MESNTLKPGSKLKNGEYVIARILGQGGFGITYEAEQVSLGRKVAIKEFFMKEHCDRDETTSAVTVPSSGSRELVEKFRKKFIREAKMIAGFDNEHIVRIYDVFEENGTAYYVMEYLDGGSLSDVIKSKSRLPEKETLQYLDKIASALKYLHKRNILHFDVKPSNVLLGEEGKLKLIDFGISKHFDEGGHQTSSTPVGISKGFAPLEQYQQEDIASFSPATDIYALGATLFNMLTGSVPPEASAVMNNGLPAVPGVSTNLAEAIEKAMSPRKKDRPQTIDEFLNLLRRQAESNVDEETILIEVAKPRPHRAPSSASNHRVSLNDSGQGIRLLRRNVQPEVEFMANFYENDVNAQGGKLWITKDKIVFKPHAFNIGDLSMKYIRIQDVAGYTKGVLTKFSIWVNDGSEMKLVVWKKNAIIEEIEKRRQAYYQSKGKPAPDLQFGNVSV